MDSNKNKKQNLLPDPNLGPRNFLTRIVFIGGLIVIVGLSVTVIWLSPADERTDSAQLVFNVVIPLVASWVGAVIAFYFGRDNYDAATQNVMKLSGSTLSGLNVKNIMINVKTIVARYFDDEDYKKHKLKDIIALYRDIEKDRIPVFTKDGIPKLMIHRRYMIEYYNNIEDPEKKNALTLQDMVNSEKDQYSHNKMRGFVTVKPSSTIKDAFNKMNEVEACMDILITENGEPNSKVVGWLTDSLLKRFLTID